jgi:hypothetical protein
MARGRRSRVATAHRWLTTLTVSGGRPLGESPFQQRQGRFPRQIERRGPLTGNIDMVKTSTVDGIGMKLCERLELRVLFRRRYGWRLPPSLRSPSSPKTVLLFIGPSLFVLKGAL